MEPEPPTHVIRVRDTEAGIAVRSPERCDYCGGSLWAWTYTRWRGQVTPEGDDWVCWMDLDGIGPFKPLG